MNDFMSLGIHRSWKRTLISHLEPNKKILDVAGGTGDVSFGYARKNLPLITPVRLIDINPDMLAVGRKRGVEKGLACVSFEEGDAEDLVSSLAL